MVNNFFVVLMVKTILINFLLFLFLVFVIELGAGKWFSVQYVSNCFTEKFHHEYCAEWAGKNALSSQDGGEEISIFVNKDGVRVKSYNDISSNYDVASFNVINIGDSFMQADEITFNGMLSSRISDMSSFKVLQVGYSSWAPIQMYNWVKSHSIQKGSIVNLFTMVNDYIPSYRSSNYGYHKGASMGNDGLFHFIKYKGKTPKPKQLVLSWRQKSFFMSRYDQVVKNKKRAISFERQFSKFKSLSGSFQKLSMDCSKLEKWLGIPPLAYDYLSFSFDEKCWKDEQIMAVNNAISDINKIYRHLDRHGIKLNVFIIPPGWSFAGENLVGKASAAYKIDLETIITIKGLASYVSRHTAVKIIDLEPVINDFKEQSDENMYFNFDGHWTKYMHNYLAAWMIKNILNGE